jgi:hypothetical protein
MKILELYFVLFSKLYVKFSKTKDDWFYIPLWIISLVICLNLLILSLLIYKISIYYFVALYFITYFILVIFLRYIRISGKKYVNNYLLSKNTLFILIFLLVADFFIIFKTLNYTRDKNIKANSEKKHEINRKDYLKY